MANPYINDLMPGEQYGMPTSTPQTLQRRSRLAQQLLEQGQQPLEGQMVSGRYVAPSWTQGLAKLLNAYQGGKIMGDIDKQEQGMAQNKQRAIADILSQSQPKTIEGQPITTETMPAYTPDQMDRFGSPMPNVQRQPEVTNNTPTRTETPEEIQARLRPLIYQAVGQYGNDPALQLALGDLNYQRERGARKEDITEQRGYEEKLYNRGRQDKLSDTEAERKYNDIVRKEQQGFQVSQQDRQFAQQFQMQAQNQGFQASQLDKQQNFAEKQADAQRLFTSGENKLNRMTQEDIAKAKLNKPQQLSPTIQKEIFEADDMLQSNANALNMLKQAKDLNNKSYSGFGAKTRAVVSSNLGLGGQKADNTINLDNLVSGQALESLKSTFGGNPTEGERRILLDLQASADKTPAQREAILNRAIELANNRLRFNQNKSKALRTGEYFNEVPAMPSSSQGGVKFLGFE